MRGSYAVNLFDGRYFIQGGKHTLTVLLNGKNYPGTPVDVEVQGL